MDNIENKKPNPTQFAHHTPRLMGLRLLLQPLDRNTITQFTAPKQATTTTYNKNPISKKAFAAVAESMTPSNSKPPTQKSENDDDDESWVWIDSPPTKNTNKL